MKTKNNFLKLTKRKALFLAVVIFAWINLSRAENNNLNIFQDQDQDGLTDQEELSVGTDPKVPDTDGDGYSDGAEVKSGYNPLKPAPGDKLITATTSQQASGNQSAKTTDENKTNLTDEFINQIQQQKGDELSVLQEFEKNPQNLNDPEKVSELSDVSLTQEELQTMLEQTLSQSGAQDDFQLMDESEIKVLPKPKGKDEDKVKAEEKKQIEEYFVATGYIMLQNAPFEINSQNELQSTTMSFVAELSNYILNNDTTKINEMKERAQKAFDQLKLVESPFVLKDVHLEGLSIMKYMLDEDMQSIGNDQDPLNQILLLGKTQAVMQEVGSMETKITTILDEYGIDSITPQEKIIQKVSD